MVLMILLVGPSASGKTEVAKILRSRYGILKAITTTSRLPRVGEKDGVDYFYVSKDEFILRKNNNHFVETTEYNGNFYGCGKDQIKTDKCVVLDPNGLKSFNALNDPSIVSFFLNTSEELRKERMLSRGDSMEKTLERLKNDKEVFKTIDRVDFVLENENETLEELADKIMKLYKEKLK